MNDDVEEMLMRLRDRAIFRNLPPGFADALSMNYPSDRPHYMGGVEGGRDGGMLSGGGGGVLNIPVGRDGQIIAEVNGGGAYGRGVSQFSPQGSVGYQHRWRWR